MNYSQNGEQAAILAAFTTPRDGVYTMGRFLDIGAFHPKQLSNTRALFELGWSGVMVEPSPGPYRGLETEYAGESRIVLVNAAVVLEGAESVTMHVTDDAVSTTSDEHYEKWRDTARFNGTAEVKTVSIEKLCISQGPFDFVSIDTEGTSVDVLQRVLQMAPLPRCICVEFDERLREVLDAADKYGYGPVYTSSENIVLVKL